MNEIWIFIIIVKLYKYLFRIRNRSDPYNLAGSGSTSGNVDPDPMWKCQIHNVPQHRIKKIRIIEHCIKPKKIFKHNNNILYCLKEYWFIIYTAISMIIKTTHVWFLVKCLEINSSKFPFRSLWREPHCWKITEFLHFKDFLLSTLLSPPTINFLLII